MMPYDRTTAFGVGLILASLAAYAALGDGCMECTSQSCVPAACIKPCEKNQCTAAEVALCVNGHPAPRSPYVTYGGLSPRPGYQRDHYVPLCLGGADSAANVRYQLNEEAHRKDKEEWQLCEAVCRGDLDPDAARLQIMKDWPR